MKQRKSGFTIIEMLISMTLLLIIFSVIAAMLTSSRRSYQATAAIAEEVEITDAAARLLRYDISLAGYIGLDGENRDLQGSPVLVLDNEDNPNSGQVVEVRYFEDRFTTNGDPELRYVSYYVGQNQEGYGLLRNDHTDLDPQLLMSDVDNLTTEMLDRGINLILNREGSEQIVRITFNIPDAVIGN